MVEKAVPLRAHSICHKGQWRQVTIFLLASYLLIHIRLSLSGIFSCPSPPTSGFQANCLHAPLSAQLVGLLSLYHLHWFPISFPQNNSSHNDTAACNKSLVVCSMGKNVHVYFIFFRKAQIKKLQSSNLSLPSMGATRFMWLLGIGGVEIETPWGCKLLTKSPRLSMG